MALLTSQEALARQPEHPSCSELAIMPLTFAQIFQSMGMVVRSLKERDAQFGRWLQAPKVVQALARTVVLPLYYHWATSGYGAFVGETLVGWLFLRGWRQMLYIDALVVHPAWRRQGVGQALMDFAEERGRYLKSRWLGLTVTASNLPALRLYKKLGFQRMHWRVMQSAAGGMPAALQGTGTVRLKRLPGLSARRWRYHFALGGSLEEPLPVDFAWSGPEGRTQRHWLVLCEDEAIAYLSGRRQGSKAVVYVACQMEWWDRPQIVEAVKLAWTELNRSGTGTTLRVSFANAAFHEAVRPMFERLGFSEQSTCRIRMFKPIQIG